MKNVKSETVKTKPRNAERNLPYRGLRRTHLLVAALARAGRVPRVLILVQPDSHDNNKKPGERGPGHGGQPKENTRFAF